jgi:hypothetical protein
LTARIGRRARRIQRGGFRLWERLYAAMEIPPLNRGMKPLLQAASDGLSSGQIRVQESAVRGAGNLD